MKADVQTLAAKKAGTVELPDQIFGLEPRSDLIHRMVTYQLAKRRAGTAKTKGRSEINGTGAKMYKQKGTGKARHSTKKAPIFRGGGKAHGPVLRDHGFSMQKKVRALALKHALSAKVKSQDLIVLDKAEVKEPKTKALKSQLTKLGLTSALIISGEEVEKNFDLAARNIAEIDVLPVQGINVYDILRRDKLVLTNDALVALEARFS